MSNLPAASGLPAGYTLDSAPAATGLPAGYALDPPSVAADIAKAAPVSLLKGAIGVAGMPGDLQGLAKNASDAGYNPFDWLAQKFKDAYPETAAANEARAGRLSSDVPEVGLPSSSDIQGAVEKATGPLYNAQTGPGKAVQTVGEFAPAALAGPGGIAKRLVTQALIPGLASEAAGQATAGTAAEPYARIAAAVGGGAVGPAAERFAASRAASAATPSIADVKSAATAGYQDPAITAVQIKPQAIDNLSDSITNGLNRQRINDRLAPQTHALIDDLKTPVNGSVHGIEDLETTRQRLGDLAGNFNNPVEQKAATQAIKALDTYSANIPQSHLIAGDASAANDALTTARANYASAATAQRVTDKLNNADLRAASTYSGGNLNNATRQNLRTLLTSKSQSRGLSPDELQTIEDTVRGSTAGNLLRAGGKLLGGGGGLGTAASAAVGHAVGGPVGAVLAPAIGFGVKKAGDAITRSNANNIVKQILSRSPLGVQNTAALPAIAPDRLAMLKRLLLANAATVPMRQPPAPVGYGQ